MTDCIVIGGGILGMMTARELAQAGLQVTLLERNQTGRESSWAGGGIISPLYPWRFSAAVTALASWSQAAYPELAEQLRAESGIDPEYTRSGLLILDTEEQARALAWAEQSGSRLEPIGRAEIARASGLTTQAVSNIIADLLEGQIPIANRLLAAARPLLHFDHRVRVVGALLD